MSESQELMNTQNEQFAYTDYNNQNTNKINLIK